MTRFAIAIAAAIMAVFLCVPAAAQNVCGPRNDIVKRLWERWGEAQTALGLINDGRMMEVFVSADEERSWTIIISDPSGRSCAASAGKNFTAFDKPKVPPGDGT